MEHHEITKRTIEILEKSNDLWYLKEYELVERTIELVLKLTISLIEKRLDIRKKLIDICDKANNNTGLLGNIEVLSEFRALREILIKNVER